MPSDQRHDLCLLTAGNDRVHPGQAASRDLDLLPSGPERDIGSIAFCSSRVSAHGRFSEDPSRER